MATWIKQSTAVDIKIGPFLDSTDGNTVESGLTITQPDIRLAKNGGAWAQKSAAQTLTHEENGWYEVALSTTDTDTLGILIVAIHETGALPVWREFLVVSANIYDSFFSTDLLQVDLIQIVGVAQSATDLKDFADDGYDPSTNKVQGVVLTDTVTTYTGNTPQTGDSFARLGAPAGASVSADIAAIEAQTDDIGVAGAGLTALGDTRLVNLDATVSSRATPAQVNTEVDTALADYDAPTFAELDARTDAIEARLPAALVGGRIDASVGAVAANAINDAGIAADMDQYGAKVWVIKESTTADHYAVAFYKNGQRVTSGVTSPTIQVIKGSDGTDLIAATALTEIGSTHRFKKDESTNKLVAGQVYFAVVSATIDGSTRTWDQQIGRDSA